MMSDRYLSSILALWLAATAVWSGACSADGPRVGLVLGGEGKEAVAVIGVLQALDQLRIPIHAISASGLGGAIGAAYASGVPVSDLTALFTRTSWEELTADTPVSDYMVAVQRAGDYELSPGRNHVFDSAEAMTGRNVDLLLQGLIKAAPASTMADFDDLPIPVRMVSFDVSTGQVMVLKSGNWALSLRTSLGSMDTRGLTRVSDRLLLNVPGKTFAMALDVARAAGADVTIVVHIEESLAGLADIDSELALYKYLLQGYQREDINRMMIQLGMNDVLIRPDLNRRELTIDEIVSTGKIATLEQSQRLLQLSLSDEAFRDWRSGLTRGGR